GVAAFVGDAAHPLLAAFDAIAVYGSSIPGAWLELTPTPMGAVLAALASVALVSACVSHFPGRPLVVGAIALAALAWNGALPAGSGFTELHMIDVGQGDA